MKKYRVWWFIGFDCFLLGDLMGPSELLGLTAYDIPLIAYVPVVAALAVVIPFALRILLLVISVSALRLLRARKAEGLLLAIGAVQFLASKSIAWPSSALAPSWAR